MFKKARYTAIILIIFGLIPFKIHAETSLVWVSDILENSEIINPTDNLETCSHFHPQDDNNIASSCKSVLPRRMSEAGRRSYCENVANNCFSHYYSKLGVSRSRDKCLNVSSDCFFEINKNSNANSAVEQCLNVSNHCYRTKRSSEQSIKSTLKVCRDVSW